MPGQSPSFARSRPDPGWVHHPGTWLLAVLAFTRAWDMTVLDQTVALLVTLALLAVNLFKNRSVCATVAVAGRTLARPWLARTGRQALRIARGRPRSTTDHGKQKFRELIK